MTRVNGRGPGRAAEVAGDADLQEVAPRSRLEPVAAVVGLGGVLVLLWTQTTFRLLPWWTITLTGAALVGSYLLWRWASVRLGKVTAGAAVGGGAFLVAGAVTLIPPTCPVTGSAGRCTGQEAAVGAVVGMLGAITAVAVTAIAVAVVSAVLRGGVLAGRGAQVAGRGLARVEQHRKERRQAGVRWLPDSITDPVAVSGAVGALAGGGFGWVVYRDATATALWAVGGLMAGGGVPAAWRAGGRARQLRAERDRRGRRGKGRRRGGRNGTERRR